MPYHILSFKVISKFIEFTFLPIWSCVEWVTITYQGCTLSQPRHWGGVNKLLALIGSLVALKFRLLKDPFDHTQQWEL